jgi:hypothetical protein
MKKIAPLLIASGLFCSAATSVAAPLTSLAEEWVCSTNASSSDIDADKIADKAMSDTAKSAAQAFAFAAEHCRDCTKITCEVKKEE